MKIQLYQNYEQQYNQLLKVKMVVPAITLTLPIYSYRSSILSMRRLAAISPILPKRTLITLLMIVS